MSLRVLQGVSPTCSAAAKIRAVSYGTHSFELRSWQLVGGYAFQPKWNDSHDTGPLPLRAPARPFGMTPPAKKPTGKSRSGDRSAVSSHAAHEARGAGDLRANSRSAASSSRFGNGAGWKAPGKLRVIGDGSAEFPRLAVPAARYREVRLEQQRRLLLEAERQRLELPADRACLPS